MPSLVQAVNANSGTNVANLSATQAGNELFVVFMTAYTGVGSVINSISDTSGTNQWFQVPGTYTPSDGSSTPSTEIWYCKNAASITQLTISSKNATFWGLWALEVAGFINPEISGTVLANLGSSSTTPTGAPITSKQVGDFILTSCSVEGVISSLVAGAFTDQSGAMISSNGNDIAWTFTAAIQSYQAQWNSSLSFWNSSTALVSDNIPGIDDTLVTVNEDGFAWGGTDGMGD